MSRQGQLKVYYSNSNTFVVISRVVLMVKKKKYVPNYYSIALIFRQIKLNKIESLCRLIHKIPDNKTHKLVT